MSDPHSVETLLDALSAQVGGYQIALPGGRQQSVRDICERLRESLSSPQAQEEAPKEPKGDQASASLGSFLEKVDRVERVVTELRENSGKKEPS